VNGVAAVADEIALTLVGALPPFRGVSLQRLMRAVRA
jgi:hypothetical protein